MREAERVEPTAAAVGLLDPMPALRARLALARGEVAEAARWVQERGLEAGDELTYPREREYLVLALLFARDGRWRDRQLVPRAWVRDPTLVPTPVTAAPAPAYQFFWWMQDDRRPRAQSARGRYGQHLYLVPESDLVLVRFGRDSGYPRWPELLSDLARRLDQPATGLGRRPPGTRQP